MSAPGALRFFGWPRRELDLAASMAVVLGLLWTRLGWLADGPWELDEVRFANGVFLFDMWADAPHPPGFPGWIALGKLAALVAPEPLVALQWVSAMASVAALWPLLALGRRVASPVVAALAAICVLLAPGPWLYSVRGFSTTTATTLALFAAWVAVGGLRTSRRATLFSVLVASAVLVRPTLLPGLAVLWLVGAASVDRWRRLAPGIAASVALGAVALTFMVLAQGGWEMFAWVFEAHAYNHFTGLASQVGGWSDLGLVKGLGGRVGAVAALLAAGAGLVVWARRHGPRSAVAWLLVLGVTAGQLLFLQNRTYGRYAVAVHLPLAPLVAGAASLLPPGAAVGALAVLCAAAVHRSVPLVAEQHEERLPAWAAVRFAESEARQRGVTMVVSRELEPFVRYRRRVVTGEGLVPPPAVIDPWDRRVEQRTEYSRPAVWRDLDRPWVVVTGDRRRYDEPLIRGERCWTDVSTVLLPLTQRRLVEACVLANPPLPVSGLWPLEHLPTGEGFLWGGAAARLDVPPVAAHSRLGLDLRPAPGSSPVEIRVNGKPKTMVPGDAGRLWIWLDGLHAGQGNRIELLRADTTLPGGGDSRPLAVQVFDVRLVGPSSPWSGSLTTAESRALVQAEVDGAYPAETFEGIGRGAWLAPEAQLELPAGPGILRLELAAPRATAPASVVRIAGRRDQPVGHLPATGREIVIPLTAADIERGRVGLEILSTPFFPGGGDQRTLGVVVSRASFEPAGTQRRLWARWSTDDGPCDVPAASGARPPAAGGSTASR